MNRRAAGCFVLFLALASTVPVLAANRATALATGSHAAQHVATRTVVRGNYRVELDPSAQVVAVDTLPERNPMLAPRIGAYGRGMFLSAALLGQKAKQFDDGLYAAVELAAERGCGRFASRRALIAALCERLPREPAGDAAEVVYAAAREAGLGLAPPPALRERVERRVASFAADPAHSKPISFYTWSDDLRAIFRQDRMLQTPLADPAGVAELATILRDDPGLARRYDAALRLASGLTNPFAWNDLRPAGPGAVRGGNVSILPPSLSRETALQWRLFPDGAVPGSFSLMDAFVDSVRAGQLSLRPGPASGWYDHEQWAFDPLLRPGAMPEAPRLDLREGYRRQLAQLFRGLAALTRETHAKQLSVVESEVMQRPRGPRVESIVIFPDLSLEPLPTHYLRRAQSYAFVRRVLVEAFGAAGLDSMARLTADGPVSEPLGAELDSMEHLFRGAFARSCAEIGADPVVVAGETIAGLDEDEAALARWREALPGDPDLSRDMRMMVPVAWNVLTGEYEVWAFIGWETHPIQIAFRKPPSLTVIDATTGSPAKSPPPVKFVAESPAMMVPVVLDLHVRRLLDRDEMRRLCDRYLTREDIEAALQK